MNQDMRKRLAKLLLELSYVRGEVTLTSGKKSGFYIDCKQTALHPEGIYLIGRIFWEMLIDYKISAFAGVTMGGDPLVTAASLASRQASLEFPAHNRRTKPLPALIIRKKTKGHGTGQFIEGMRNVKQGDSVALLEDVITTGGSSLRACEAIENAKLKVAVIGVIVDRQEGGRENIEQAGYALKSIFTRESLLAFDEKKWR